MKRAIVLGVLMTLLAGCSSSETSVPLRSPSQTAPASASASASTSPATSPAAPPSASIQLGVLATWDPSQPDFSVALVAADGRIAATAFANTPRAPRCIDPSGNPGSPYLPPPVSTSNSHLYFLDSDGVVHALGPDGSTNNSVYTLPIGSTRWTFFAVSPDDSQIAYTMVDYSASKVFTQLSVGALPHGPQKVLYSETSTDTLRPLGWHTGELVLAKVAACPASGPGGPASCCGIEEIHLVDPATAKRLATLGGGSYCTVAGPPTPAGILCETTEISYNGVNWQGQPTQINEWISGLSAQTTAYLSTDGTEIAVSQDGTNTTVWVGNSTPRGPYSLLACGWIDGTHVLAGGNTQSQARLLDVTSGSITPVAAQGQCAGRIPGGL